MNMMGSEECDFNVKRRRTTENTTKYRNRLLVIFLFILSSPLASFYFPQLSGSLELWMIASVLGVLLFFNGLVYSLRVDAAILPLLLLAYISFSSLGFAYYSPSTTMFRYGLFTATFCVFLAINNLSFKFRSEASWRSWWEGIRLIVIIVCAYGIYQFLARLLDLPLDGGEVYRGRSDGAVQQITSFFEEPAFLCLFLVAILYVLLFVKRELDWLLIFVILVTVLMSRSMGGVISSAILLSLYLTSNLLSATLKGVYTKGGALTLILLTVFLPLVFLVFNGSAVIDEIVSRFENEVVSSFSYVGVAPFDVGELGSGGIRLVNEINWIIYTFEQNPFLGFGISYADTLVRTTSLNAIAEIAVRWGALGVVGFFLLIVEEKVRFPPQKLAAFWVFVLLYFFMDGAIAKIEFWLPLAIVFLAERHRDTNESVILK